MKKQMYMTPEVGVAPLYLSACIMSGGNTGPDQDEHPDSVDFNAAPGRRVF